jgi:Zn-dependent protease
VYLAEPNRTPLDLNWWMFGTHIRVSPMFWLSGLLLGAFEFQRGFQFIVLWIACFFVSILVHEFGHVLMGRLFGAQGHIVMYGFGGVAIGSSDLQARWQRVFVYLAGPLAGFILAGLVTVGYVYLVLQNPDPIPPLAATALSYLLFMNLIWGIFNLIPIWPLDGGQLSREFFTWITPDNGLRISLGISMVLAGVLAVVSVVWRQFFLALFFGLLAFSSFQMMQQLPPRYREEREEFAPWERDPDYWKRG